MTSGISRRAAIGAGLAAGAAGVLVGREVIPAHQRRSETYSLRGAHQPGITTEMQNHLHFASFDVTTRSRHELEQMLMAWTVAAERMMSGQPAGPVGPVGGRPELAPDDTGEAMELDTSNLSITVGFGPGLFRDRKGRDRFGLAQRQPEALRPLPRFPLDQLTPGASGGDLCVQSCADDPQIAVHAVRNLTRIGFGTVGMRWSQHGFGRSSATTPGQTTPRNLMGFKDGTANIRSDETEELDKHVWVAPSDDRAGAWLGGGSYLITRRAMITVELWDRQKLRDQEEFIGRTKSEGAPLTGRTEFDEPDFRAMAAGEPVIPEDAHVRVVHPTHHGGARMLRRGYNIADGTNEIGRMDAGLFFIAFVRDPAKQFIPIQKAMVKSDILMEYLRFTQQSIFAVPPGIADGQSIGHALFKRG
ncbi:MAG TPA: iron uptake transporter deferrochelatase/peroxidase subunit [Aeromicrobium sp.]|nr:iron uptake transporter deferrochelatase/peroxidase subunit [Aeromicrobium sp.]